MKQRAKCRRARVDPDGTPVCGHGERMYLFGGGWRCAVRIRERLKNAYHADPAAKRAKSRRYYEEHADQERQRARDRYQANPEYARAKNARRIRVLGIHLGTVGFTASETEALVNGTPKRP